MLRYRDGFEVNPAGSAMTFQAYLDNIEKQTGVRPEQWIDLARAKGFGKGTKATPVTDWLKAQYGLGHGHGHAMAVVKLLKDSDVL